MDLSDRDEQSLRNMIDNYRRHGKTQEEPYIEALRELERRRGKGLDLQKTLQLVQSRASERKFVRYREVAEVNGFEWAKIHWEIGKHLEALCEYGHRRGLPLLSSIVVNSDGVETGSLKPASKAGLIAAAEKLGYRVSDTDQFIAEQQTKVFDWASKANQT